MVQYHYKKFIDSKYFNNLKYIKFKKIFPYLKKDKKLYFKLYGLYNKNITNLNLNLTRFYTRKFYKYLNLYQKYKTFNFSKFKSLKKRVMKGFKTPKFQKSFKDSILRYKEMRKLYLLGKIGDASQELRDNQYIHKNLLYNVKKSLIINKVKFKKKKLKSLKFFKVHSKILKFCKKRFFFDSLNLKLKNIIKFYNVLKTKNIHNLKNLNFLNCTKYNFFLFRESFKFYEKNLKICFLKNFLLNSLMFYTGYNQINLNFKPIFKTFNKNLENKYFKLSDYCIFNKNLKKYKSRFLGKFMAIKLLKWNNFYISMIKFFTFYEQKLNLNFLKRIYYYITLPYRDLYVYFFYLSRLIFDIFKYIYKKKKGYFRKAFEFFNKILYSLFTKSYLYILSGLKIIAKGRFGKNRKQIGRIQLGYLKLHTVSQLISYSNNLLITKRGSYGFHIWCSFLNTHLFGGSTLNTNFLKI